MIASDSTTCYDDNGSTWYNITRTYTEETYYEYYIDENYDDMVYGWLKPYKNVFNKTVDLKRNRNLPSGRLREKKFITQQLNSMI